MKISQTIPSDIAQNGEGEGPLPLYFRHQDLINKLAIF